MLTPIAFLIEHGKTILKQYRHIIDWLVRKPGAFDNYRYRDELFAGSYFRMAYDYLKDNHSRQVASRQYLQILHLAATDGDARVEGILKELLDAAEPIRFETVKDKLSSDRAFCAVNDVQIPQVDLILYDALLDGAGKEVAHG